MMINYFSLPAFDDPDIQRRANILVATQLASVAMIVLVVLVSVILTPEHPEVLIQGAVGGGFMFASFYLTKKGKLDIAAWIIAVLGWLIMTLDLIFISGIRGVNVLGQVLIVIFAGLAINGKAGLLVTLASVLANFGVYQAESLGLIANHNPLPTGFTRWFIQAMYLSLAAIYVWRADTTISEAIQESQSTADRFRTLFMNTNDGVVVFDRDWKVLMANPQITELLGYSLEEITLKELIPSMFSHDSDAIMDLQHDVAAGRDIPNFEHHLVRKDRTELPVEISITIVREPNGKPRHIQCVLRDITARRAFEKELKHQAHHDPLTNLPNRAYFENRYKIISQNKPDNEDIVAILFLDLDDFKEVNDKYGHSAGDQVLIDLGTRLLSSVRESDTVARYGGDEFIIILENVFNKENVSRIAEKIIDQVTLPYQVGDDLIHITASIGINITPRHELIDTDLITSSDKAMYQVKKSGKNNYLFFKDQKTS